MKSSQENILGLSTNPEMVKDQSLIQFLAEPPNQERASWWQFSNRVDVLGFRPSLKALHPKEVHYPTFVFQGLLFYIEQVISR